MEYVKHEKCNTVIGAPQDMRKDCGALPVRIWSNEFGPWATSYWRPTPEQLVLLNAGGAVAVNLRVGHGQHPVMFVDAEK